MIGFATAGKSTVGKLLAAKLNAEFVDTDAEIERVCGASVQQIFDTLGEEYFRQRENELLLTLANKQGVVIACGGGSVLAEGLFKLAKDSVVVWLSAEAATVKRRLGGVPRPLFDGLSEAELQAFVNARAPLYKRYADVTIATDNLTPEQVVSKISLQ